MELLISENKLLNQQKSLLDEELQNYQVELNKRTTDIHNASQKISELESYLDATNKRLKQAEKDRDSAGAIAIEFSDALGKLKVDHDKIKKEYVEMQKQNAELNRNVMEIQQSFRKYKEDMDREGYECVELAQKAEERANHLKSELNKKSIENDSLQEVLRNLKREYQATRQDAEGMIHVMGSLERRVSEYASKEEETNSKIKDWRSKMEDALTLKVQVISHNAKYHFYQK
jgi:chromosome segregation ATPase